MSSITITLPDGRNIPADPGQYTTPYAAVKIALQAGWTVPEHEARMHAESGDDPTPYAVAFLNRHTSGGTWSMVSGILTLATETVSFDRSSPWFDIVDECARLDRIDEQARYW